MSRAKGPVFFRKAVLPDSSPVILSDPDANDYEFIRLGPGETSLLEFRVIARTEVLFSGDGYAFSFGGKFSTIVQRGFDDNIINIAGENSFELDGASFAVSVVENSDDGSDTGIYLSITDSRLSLIDGETSRASTIEILIEKFSLIGTGNQYTP